MPIHMKLSFYIVCYDIPINLVKNKLTVEFKPFSTINEFQPTMNFSQTIFIKIIVLYTCF